MEETEAIAIGKRIGLSVIAKVELSFAIKLAGHGSSVVPTGS
ncbi:MAG: hypothetical protein ABW172_05655 [Candidatus Binatia bacterium]|jgi:hypothetical protein